MRVSYGIFDELELTIPIYGISVSNRNIFVHIWLWLWLPKYENYLGYKCNITAWRFRFGPVSAFRLKTDEEFTKEFAE